MQVKLGIISFLLVSLGALAYATAPAITSFTPSSALSTRWSPLPAQNFTTPPTVYFNGVKAIDIWVNYTTITAKVPAGAVSGPISVTTSGGTALSAGVFTVTNPVIPPPTITSFTPNSGYEYTQVTITGANFTTPPSVSFNGAAAQDIWVNSTTITARVPAGAGSGPITVTTSGGTVTSAGAFTVTKTAHPAAHHHLLHPDQRRNILRGHHHRTNFNHASSVQFNGVPSVFKLVNSTTITAKVEASYCSGSISVTTPGGTASTATYFIAGNGVYAPGINSIDNAEMVWVPGGSFTMGPAEAADGANGTAHQVTLNGYWIYTNEVTVAQYLAFLSANPTYISPDSGSHLPPWPGDWIDQAGNSIPWCNSSSWTDPAMQQMPIVNVSWNDAFAYATWAGVSLPTEAQYEYAARGPAENNYPWGGTATQADPDNGWNQANCANALNTVFNDITTVPVGSFPMGSSWCGTQDLAGNVLEWCADWFGNYSDTRSPTP